MKNYKGRLVVPDGPEGAGKSTVCEKAKKEFGDRVLCTCEPGGSEVGKLVKSIMFHPEYGESLAPMTQFLLAWADRDHHLRSTIIPALEAGKVVICDRYDSSTYAYQVVAEDEDDEKKSLDFFFWNMRAQVLNHGNWVPDLYVYFDLDPIIGLERKAKQRAHNKNYMDELPLAFHMKVQEGFERFMSYIPQLNQRRINAASDPEKVYSEFRLIIEEQLKLVK